MLLFTVFSLSVKYQSTDVSLAVSSGMLALLSELCGRPHSMLQTTHALTYSIGHSHLDTMLRVASMRLLQILAITAG